METDRYRKRRDVSEIVKVNTRAGWKLAAKVITFTNSTQVEEETPISLSMQWRMSWSGGATTGSHSWGHCCTL